MQSTSGSAMTDFTQPATAVSVPRGTTVLHIGDSFAGALGLDLNRELKAVGVRSILKYQTSSYIPNWASGKEIEQYLANYNPDLVLVTLGANELEIPDPQERVRTIRKLVSRIGQRPCVWIGPPLWEGARPALLEVIRKECAPCVYLDSTAHLPKLARARDGIHPSGPARTEWATFVLQWLSAHRDPSGTQPWSLRASP
jgi:lysophospholipase L1-like esterase